MNSTITLPSDEEILEVFKNKLKSNDPKVAARQTAGHFNLQISAISSLLSSQAAIDLVRESRKTTSVVAK